MSTAKMPAPEHGDRTVPNESNRVLIIEDDEAVRVAVERGLIVHGFKVGAVADAETALLKIANHPPDVVIVEGGITKNQIVDQGNLTQQRRSRVRPCGKKVSRLVPTGSKPLIVIPARYR